MLGGKQPHARSDPQSSCAGPMSHPSPCPRALGHACHSHVCPQALGTSPLQRVPFMSGTRAFYPISHGAVMALFIPAHPHPPSRRAPRTAA